MKKTIKGITYDTAFSIPLCTCTYQYGKEEVIETAYRTPMMQYFIFQRIGNGEKNIFPATNDDMVRWTGFDRVSGKQIWIG